MALITIVDRAGGEHSVEAAVDQPLMETLRRLEFGVAALCGGMCSCATCHVYVDEAWLPRLPVPHAEERELLSALEHVKVESRLSCQIQFTEALRGLRVTIAPEE